jgi:protein-tyrosine-phosphatase
LGVDLSKARPQSVADLDEDAHYDLIISLSPEAHHRMLDMVPKLADAAEYWQTLDPSIADGNREQRLMEYRAVRDMIDQRIAKRFPKQSFGQGGT